MLCQCKYVENRDLDVQLEVKLKYDTPISLGLEDVVSNPIQVLKVQQHNFVPNLNVKPPGRDGFKDIVADAFSAEE